MSRLPFLALSIFFLIAPSCFASEESPIPEQVRSCTGLTGPVHFESEPGENVNMIGCLRENVIISCIVVGLIALGSFIYYNHLQKFNRTRTPSTSDGLTSTTSQPSLHNVLSTSQEQSMPRLKAPPALEIFSSETRLKTINSQPNLTTFAKQAPPLHQLMDNRAGSETPPSYAHPVAMRFTNDQDNGLLSPTSSAQITESWNKLLKKLNTRTAE